MAEFWKVGQGAYEAIYSSGGFPYDLSRYETSFGAALGLETTASVISGSARLYEFTAVNRTGNTLFAQIFDLTGGPGPGARPIMSIPILSASEKGFSWRTGRSFVSGVMAGWSTDYSAFTASANAGAFYIEYRR
jgi:hypothetical protein